VGRPVGTEPGQTGCHGARRWDTTNVGRKNDSIGIFVAELIVSDMNAAYARLRGFRVEHASSGPQRLPDWNPDAGSACESLERATIAGPSRST
jgi:hypothetical protein